MEKFFLFAAIGSLSGLGAMVCLNRMPAEWLCDYGEPPGARHRERRMALWPGGIFCGAFLGLWSGTLAELYGWAYGAAGLAALWLLVQIAAADRRFGVIPDQYVLALAGTAAAFILPDFFRLYSGHPALCRVHLTFASPLLGALICGGGLLALGLLGRLFYRREVLGFGDVKLLAALGLALGLRGGLFVTAAAILLSGLAFAFLLTIKKAQWGDEKPLGPFIAAACALWLLAGGADGSSLESIISFRWLPAHF